MKKLIGILLATLLPVVSLAQEFTYRFYGDGFDGRYSHGSFGFFGLFMIIFIPLVLIAIGIYCIILWVMMLIDAIKNCSEDTKVVWVLVIVFTHIIGALIYYFVEKKQRNTFAQKVEEKKDENK